MSLILTNTPEIETLKPREKIIEFGIESLNDSELLSSILGTGYKGLSIKELSQQLFSEFGTKGLFQFSDLDTFQEQTGLPPVKSFQILAIGELFRRISKRDNTKLKSSEQVYEYVKDSMLNSSYEKVNIICVDSQRRVLYSGLIAQGESNRVRISLASIFHHPIRLNCKHFYLIHNHPHGDSQASEADLSFTLKIKEEAEKFQLHFDDHIIVGQDGFYSFSLEGVL